MGKVVEIPTNMTARDLCQLLVYKSHCVDDNSWALVEHHPLLGLGKGQSPGGLKHCSHSHKGTHEHTWTDARTLSLAHTDTRGLLGGLRHAIQSLTYTGVFTCMHACMRARILGQTVQAHILTQACIQAWMHAHTIQRMHEQRHNVQWSNQVQHTGCVKVAVAVQY